MVFKRVQYAGMSQTKKIEIVDVVIVDSVMWAEGWERGERAKSQRVGQ
jgi:hypothetical protein